MTNQKLIEQIESMTMVGAGADDPQARFGYDRARGDILNLLRSQEANWATAGNADYELHGKPRPPANADVVAGPVINITSAGQSIDLCGALQESLRAERMRSGQRLRGW